MGVQNRELIISRFQKNLTTSLNLSKASFFQTDISRKGMNTHLRSRRKSRNHEIKVLAYSLYASQEEKKN